MRPGSSGYRKIGLAVVIYGFVLSIVWFNKDASLALLERSSGSVALMLALAVLLAFFPVLPYKLLIAVAAYAFGTAGGALLCWLGASTAAVLMYYYARAFIGGATEDRLSRSPKLKRFAERFGRRPFWFVFAARLVPFLPQQLVNLYAAAAGIRPWPYIAGTALGKLPLMLLYAFAGEKLLSYLFGH